MTDIFSPILSIVVPTREGTDRQWLDELLKVRGEVEFILVHPPGMAKYAIEDRRLQQINSSFRGEIIQRLTGLLNASGQYVLTINCDEYLTPEILTITQEYFTQFPDNWVVRLTKKHFDFGDRNSLIAPWEKYDFKSLSICDRSNPQARAYENNNCMLEIPIAPLDNKFDLACLFRQRKDHHGVHTENFDKKVWKNNILQSALQELSQAMIIAGPIKYVPFWCLDRLLGLFIQAKFYEKGKIIGHLLPFPEQIRVEENPPEYTKSKRFYMFAEVLLLKRFPQYGYLWNLIIDQIRGTIFRGLVFVAKKS
jgi:glycosyltransferase involved in cell wall biosynthesis